MIVLGKDIRRSHIAALTAALARHGRVECQSHIAVLCHLLRVESGGLFLYRAERSRNDDRLILFARVKILREVEMTGDLESIAVLEADILCLDGLVYLEYARIIVEFADRCALHLRGLCNRLCRCCCRDNRSTSAKTHRTG